jgi:tetratricopeptide (TPR) repeat protein
MIALRPGVCFLLAGLVCLFARPQTLVASEFQSAESCARAAGAMIRSGGFRAAMQLCERGMRVYPNSDRIEAVYLSLPAESLAQRLAERYGQVQQTQDVRELIALGRVVSDLDPHRLAAGGQLAEPLLVRAIELAPDNPSAYYNYGRALRIARKYPEMFAAWEKALLLKPGDDLEVLIYTRIGQARLALSEPGAAESAFRAALASNRKLTAPDAASAYEYFLFLKERSELDGANALLAEILRWQPLFVPALMERAKLFANHEDWPKAIEECDNVLRYADGNAMLLRSAHSLLARAYQALSQPEKARIHAAWIESH